MLPDDMIVSRFLRRLGDAVLECSLCGVVRSFIPARGNGRVTGAADVTGLASGAIRMCFVKGLNNLGQGCAGDTG